jgi:hypothetical protein
LAHDGLGVDKALDRKASITREPSQRARTRERFDTRQTRLFVQLVEQCLGVLETDRVEAFGEARVERG